jgi:hypothetical protein
MYTLKTEGRGVHLFLVRYQRRLGPAIDSMNRNIAGRLTKQAKKNIDDTRLRESEKGSRPSKRLTGTLQGHSGRSSAIQGEALNPGATNSNAARQGKGVGWPKLDVLQRRARHWRSLEYGTPYVTMPRGVFLNEGGSIQQPSARSGGDVFYSYSDYMRKTGLRRGPRFRKLTQRQSQARQGRIRQTGRSNFLVGKERRGSGIKAKHFLQNAWEDVVGTSGEKAFQEQVQVIEKIFPDFIG